MEQDEILRGLETAAAYLSQPMQDQPALVEAIDAAKAEIARLRAQRQPNS
jgi:hypothetical protein